MKCAGPAPSRRWSYKGCQTRCAGSSDGAFHRTEQKKLFANILQPPRGGGNATGQRMRVGVPR